MKLFAIALSIVTVPVFGQGNAPFPQRSNNTCFIAPVSETSNLHVVGCTPEREAQIRQAVKIKTAIARHRSFELPEAPLGPGVSVTASALSDDGYAMTLTGVEIVSRGLVVKADELVYEWASRRVEARGNVQLTAPQ
jgi:lipopolysaccharide assembly outer membrane protein LptD (OstA)